MAEGETLPPWRYGLKQRLRRAGFGRSSKYSEKLAETVPGEGRDGPRSVYMHSFSLIPRPPITPKCVLGMSESPGGDRQGANGRLKSRGGYGRVSMDDASLRNVRASRLPGLNCLPIRWQITTVARRMCGQ